MIGVLAKTPPPEVTEPIRMVLEYALWGVLVTAMCWVIASGGHLALVKFGGGSFDGPISRILRSLIGAVLATSSLAISAGFLYATKS